MRIMISISRYFFNTLFYFPLTYTKNFNIYKNETRKQNLFFSNQFSLNFGRFFMTSKQNLILIEGCGAFFLY